MAYKNHSQFYVSSPGVNNGSWGSSQSPSSGSWGVSSPELTSGAWGVEELIFNPLSPMLDTMLSDHKSGQTSNPVQGKTQPSCRLFHIFTNFMEISIVVSHFV